METTVVRFRTAFNGFHKDDVTKYISQTAAAHGEAMSKLSDQLRDLEQENEKLRNSASDTDRIAELEGMAAELAALQEENGLLKNRVRQLEYKLEEAIEATNGTSKPDAESEISASTEEPVDIQEKELEAYRRAEAMERRVSQRTRLINDQLEEIAKQTSCQLTSAMASAKGVLGVIESQIAVLQNATEGVDTAMADGLERIHAVTDIMPDSDMDADA